MRKLSRSKKKGTIGYYISEFKKLDIPDYRLIVSVAFLLTFGVIMVFSAGGVSNGRKQLIFALMGLVVMVLVSCVDYHIYARYAVWLFGLAIGGLFLTRVPGIMHPVNGAHRWIYVLGVSFQPSELVKPALVLVSAGLIINYGKRITYYKYLFAYLAVAVFAAGLILKVTEDLSTAVIIMAISVIMLFVAYPNKTIWLWILVGLIFAAVVIYFVIWPKVQYYREFTVIEEVPFRWRRILTWLYPEISAYKDASRQSRYSLYSFGFGGLWGRGLGSGTMKYYLSEPENDFIFAVVAEELGVMGCIAVVYLFSYHIWRIAKVSRHAKDPLGTYIALGIMAHIAVQCLFNLGVASGVLPNTGISLPFVSKGGTALLVQLAEIGVVLNVSRQIPGPRIKPAAEREKPGGQNIRAV